MDRQKATGKLRAMISPGKERQDRRGVGDARNQKGNDCDALPPSVFNHPTDADRLDTSVF